MVKDPNPKISVHGFNNLTKSLSFNIFDIAYAKTEQHRKEYIEYIDELYNAEHERHHCVSNAIAGLDQRVCVTSADHGPARFRASRMHSVRVRAHMHVRIVVMGM